MPKPAPAKPDTASETEALPPKKNKKKLIIIIATVLLLAGSGAVAFLLMKPAVPAKQGEEAVAKQDEEAAAQTEDETPVIPPKFIALGTFTANLIREEGDRYLQVAISLKVTQPELEEKIKAANPEILHHVNMLLQSKRPSDLASIEGKEKLAQQIKGKVEHVLGLRDAAPATTEIKSPDAEVAPAAPAETPVSQSGVSDVLFTSFIIQ
ncbi:MAG: flagellar basal body-associated FliL family protein [Candidatus Nitrotoga sp.]